MGLYTSIHFAPNDRAWTAPDDFVRKLAARLRVDTFEHHTIYRRPLLRLPFFRGNSSKVRVASTHKVSIEEGISAQQIGSGISTHMMFPYGDFMKDLTAELTAQIPEEIYGAYCPWDASIYNGHWETLDYKTGKRTESGSFAFVISADECPPDLNHYLEHFSKVPGIQKLTEDLADMSGQPWAISINLS